MTAGHVSAARVWRLTRRFTTPTNPTPAHLTTTLRKQVELLMKSKPTTDTKKLGNTPPVSRQKTDFIPTVCSPEINTINYLTCLGGGEKSCKRPPSSFLVSESSLRVYPFTSALYTRIHLAIIQVRYPKNGSTCVCSRG